MVPEWCQFTIPQGLIGTPCKVLDDYCHGNPGVALPNQDCIDFMEWDPEVLYGSMF